MLKGCIFLRRLVPPPRFFSPDPSGSRSPARQGVIPASRSDPDIGHENSLEEAFDLVAAGESELELELEPLSSVLELASSSWWSWHSAASMP